VTNDVKLTERSAQTKRRGMKIDQGHNFTHGKSPRGLKRRICSNKEVVIARAGLRGKKRRFKMKERLWGPWAPGVREKRTIVERARETARFH